VTAQFPEQSCIGFQSLFNLDEVPAGSLAVTAVTLFGNIDTLPVPWARDQVSLEDFSDQVTRKRARLAKILACPICGHDALDDRGTSLECQRCGHRVDRVGNAWDFLPDASRTNFRVTETSNISAWGYDDRAMSLVNRYSDGLILDCGSGLRPSYLENVINYEVAAYPTTDILGVGERLPFIDSCFDAVFSFAVLEHVTDPFRCAEQMARVLKPAGVLFGVVPFLQPFHGFPSHYYNMTSEGLRRLFDSSLDVVECAVPQQGLPIFSLTWILQSYLRGLPPEIRDEFKKMTVEQLAIDPWGVVDRPFVQQLSPSATRDLAATNFIIAVKR